MNFEFSADQHELQNQLSRQLADAFPIARVMRVLEGDLAERKLMWREFVELGYLGMAIPENYGGVGYGYLELCLMAQEIGRLGIPVPMLSNIYLAAEAIVQFGSEQQKQNWLPKILSGEVNATFAWSEDDNGQAPDVINCQLDSGLLSGVKTPVPDTDMADIAVVVANGRNGELALCLVNLKQQGVSLQPLEVIDEASPHASISFDGAMAEVLGGVAVDLDRLFNRAAVLLAFDQVGGAQQCLEMSKSYAAERFVFGRAIASYQVLKHKMVDMYVFNELALSHGYFAAWALENDADELAQAAAGVRLAAIKAYEYAAAETIQIHGGVGYTWEYPCHIYFKRSRIAAASLGGKRRWQNKLVSSLIESGATI